MCFIPLSRSVFPWFPVHVCWQRLLVLVPCPVLCNGDLVGLGLIYSPQPSAAPWSACFFQQRWSTLWDMSVKALHHWLTLFWGSPELTAFRFAFNSVTFQIFTSSQICSSESLRLLMRFRSFFLKSTFSGKSLILVSRKPVQPYFLIWFIFDALWFQHEVDGLKLQMT